MNPKEFLTSRRSFQNVKDSITYAEDGSLAFPGYLMQQILNGHVLHKGIRESVKENNYSKSDLVSLLYELMVCESRSVT